jgi:hypothetical protein
MFLKRQGLSAALNRVPDLSVFSQDELNAFAFQLSTRSRKKLGFKTSLEVFMDLISRTQEAFIKPSVALGVGDRRVWNKLQGKYLFSLLRKTIRYVLIFWVYAVVLGRQRKASSETTTLKDSMTLLMLMLDLA